MTKICSGCKKELPISSFHKHKVTLDKLQSRCKMCDVRVKKEKRKRTKLLLVDIKGGGM